MAKNGTKKSESGEIEVSGYFETGWSGEGEEEIPEKQDLGWLVGVTMFFAGLLLLRITYLQVINSSYYRAQAEENRIKKISTLAPRGIIYDRNRNVLATNAPRFNLTVVPALLPKDISERGKIFAQVARLTGLPSNLLEEKYKSEKADSFDPITVAENLDRDKALKLEVESSQWNGIILDREARRSYPTAEVGSHLLGYTGKINEEELRLEPQHSLTDIVGKDGMEAKYDSYLQGEKGTRQFEVNAKGEVQRLLRNTPAVIGNSLVLTVDLDLQREAHQALEEKVQETGGSGGAVVAMDPRDGGILTLASYPSYNNNEFAAGIDPGRYSEITDAPNRPLFDRAVGGTYPPGSTFKPLIAAAALEEKVITPGEVLDCPANIQINQWHFEDWKYHGLTDLNKAIAESVNTYFYIIGGGWGDKKGLGPQNIKKYGELFNLGSKLGIDLPQEASGLMPDPEWKKAKKNEAWYIGDTYHLSIGQGDLLLTPLQLTNYISALVNGGLIYRPHLLDYVERPETIETQKETIFKYRPEIIRKDFISTSDLSAVKRAMEETVDSEMGSGRKLQELANKYGVKIGGKTGTAQTGEEDKYHAWFVGFAPLDNPEIVVAVLVEKGGEGYQTALPVAERILDKYLQKRASR